MAHELTLRKDGRYEMAFVGDTPWHGLGQSLTKDASVGVWTKEAGFDWEAYAGLPRVTCFTDPATGKNEVIDDVDFSDYKALFRSDTLAPLAIVGKDYQPHQPRQLMEFFREFTEGGGWHIHTAGTMRGGRKLWVMATCEDAGRYIKGKADAVALNLLLATSLDGSMQTTGVLTNVRVVCANTLRIALENGNDAMVKLSHRSSFDSKAIKDALGVEAAQKNFTRFMETARELSETPVSLDEARELLAQIFKKDEKKQKPKLDLSWMRNLADTAGPQDDVEEVEDTRSVNRILELFDGEGMGATLPTAKDTRWGLLNAVSQFVDHEMGRTRDTGLDSAWFGRGAGFKKLALAALTEEA